jgi:hypothetical protein
MNRQDVRKALEKFLENKEHGVLALSGSWGVGKTHLIREFLATDRSKHGFNGHSYASLFGVADIEGMRAKATECMILHEDRRKVLKRYASDAKVSLVPFDLLFKGAQTLVGALKGGWAGVASQTAYWFLRDSLVCLDDIERVDPALTPSMIMGFVDELRGKGCKVIVVLNRDKLLQPEAYARYWEKVVDADIKLTPQVSENVALAFSTGSEVGESVEWAQQVFEAVRADNLRVHKRAAWLFRELDGHLASCSANVRQYVLTHASLLTWALLDPDVAISPSVLLSEKFGFIYLSITRDLENRPELSREEKAWVEATQKLMFTPASFDPLLVELIQTGWCNPDAAAESFASINRESQAETARLELREVLRLYGESFKLDQISYAKALRSVLQENIDLLNVFEFDEGIAGLQRNADKAEDLVAAFVERRGEHLQRVAEAEGRDSIPKNTLLAAEVARREAAFQQSRFTIDGVAQTFASHDGWSNRQTSFLASRTPEEFREWILSGPADLRLKIRAILEFRKYGGPENAAVAAPLIRALETLAAGSEFNRVRIAAVYGIGV